MDGTDREQSGPGPPHTHWHISMSGVWVQLTFRSIKSKKKNKIKNNKNQYLNCKSGFYLVPNLNLCSCVNTFLPQGGIVS